MVDRRGEGAQTIGRRRWLISAAVGSSLLVAGGWTALVRTGGYASPAGPLRTLSRAEYTLVLHLARRLVAPDGPDAPSPDELGVAAFIDAYIGRLRPRICNDFLRMLHFTEHFAPLGSGYLRRFTSLDGAAQDRVLAALEASSSDQLRAGFQALKTVVMMGYYRNPRTFALLQYGGPLVAPSEDAAP